MRQSTPARDWERAWGDALYGPDGLYARGGAPGRDFATASSAHAAVLAEPLARLVARVDAALGHPALLDVVEVAAGRGDLLAALARALPEPLARRVRWTGVDVAPRPAGLPDAVAWEPRVPLGAAGLLLALEWLDAVPCPVVGLDRRDDPAGAWRRLRVDGAGEESWGDPVAGEDLAWLSRWWPAPTLTPECLPAPGQAPGGRRAEVGRPRDRAWAEAVGRLAGGVAVAVDYGHVREERPAGGSLLGYRGGRAVPAVPDGRTDVTAHVALDAVAAAVPGSALTTQAAALRALGLDAAVPARPGARALARASRAAALLDPAGLGGFGWVESPARVGG